MASSLLIGIWELGSFVLGQGEDSGGDHLFNYFSIADDEDDLL
jgi:hypothetical protein